MSVEKRTQLCFFLCLGLSFFIPVIFATNFALNHFYVYGGEVLDSGWFAYLSTHSTKWLLPNPPVIGGTYLAVHVTPIFYLFSFLYFLLSFVGLDLPGAVFFSLIQGSWFGLISLSCFLLLLPQKKPLNKTCILLAFLFSVFVMLNGISLSIIAYPHSEIAIPALFFAFFAFWLREYKKISVAFLVLGLLIREDAGLHYFGLLSLLAIFLYFSKVDKQLQVQFKSFLYLAVFCLIYSLTVIVMQKFLFHSKSLTAIYLGSPIYHHVSLSFLHERLYSLLKDTKFIYWPLLALIIIVIYRKSGLLALGGIAVLPWIMLSVLAISPAAGDLMTYYAAPILIAFCWPAIVYGFLQRFDKINRAYSSYWRDASIVVGLSAVIFILGHAGHRYVWSNFGFQWIKQVKTNQTALNTFFTKNMADNSFLIDDASAVIVLDKVKRENWCSYHVCPELKSIDVVIFQPHLIKYQRTMEHKYELLMMSAKKNGLTKFCAIANSSYMIAVKLNDPHNLCTTGDNTP